jgi:hypothetical protein
MFRILKGAVPAVIAVTIAVVASAGASTHGSAHAAKARSGNDDNFETVHLRLDPSSSQLASCMPNSRIDVYVDLTTDLIGADIVRVKARHLAPNRDYTLFFLEQAASPFGAAEYFGDISTDKNGNAYNKFKLIAEEAFSSTLVNGKRQLVDLNQIGAWFADPAEDDFCLHDNPQIVTPFDGDKEAGVQAFNSRNATPLP